MEDGWFHENKVEYPYQEQLVSRLPKHDILSIIVNPKDGGYANTRPRRFTSGLNKATTVWAGPSMDVLQEVWDAMYMKASVCTGSIYLLAGEQDSIITSTTSLHLRLRLVLLLLLLKTP